MSDKIEQLVTFTVHGEEYGLPIMDVFEIIFVPPITVIAKAPPAIIGIVNLRGQIIPVIDLRILFKQNRTEQSKKQRVIVTKAKGQTVGLLVDEVTEVLRTDRALVDQAPQSLNNSNTSYIRSIYKLEQRMVVLLDMDRVLTSTETVFLQQAL